MLLFYFGHFSVFGALLGQLFFQSFILCYGKLEGFTLSEEVVEKSLHLGVLVQLMLCERLVLAF